MAIEHTPRLGLTQWTDPGLLDPVHPDQFNADAAALDDLAAIAVQGTAAERPAFGVRGRLYYATDTGDLTYDTGTAWVAVGATDATVAGYIDDPESATGSRVVRKGDLFINVKDYGVVGDGVTDDTTAIQAAIDAATARGGGVVFMPPGIYAVTTLQLKRGVHLTSFAQTAGYIGSTATSTVLLKALDAAGYVVNVADGEHNASLTGIDINGSNLKQGGVLCAADRFTLANAHILNMKREGVQLANTALACTIRDVLIYNVLKDEPTAHTGALIIRGTDHFLKQCEVSGSLSAASASGFKNAVLVDGTNCMIDSCVGEIADRGWYVTGDRNRFSLCRGDLNWLHDWEVATGGGSNIFIGCLALNGGRAAANTYSGFLVNSNAAGEVFVGCKTTRTNANTYKHGFEDANATASTRNVYVACTADGFGTAAFSHHLYQGSGIMLPSHVVRATADATTLDVSGTEFVTLQTYTTPTTVTQFNGGLSGQKVTLIGDSNVTIQNGSSIKTNTGANKQLADNVAYQFVHYNGVWYEMA